MRTIYLIRHAKAEAIAPSDKARQLAPQGMIDAAKLGQLFQHDIIQPNSVICSDAERTTQTLSLMRENGLSCENITFDEGLYHASASYIQTLISKSADKIIMVIGHNPAMAILLNQLAPADSVAPDLMHFPTGSLACLDFADGISQSAVTQTAFYKGANL